MQNKFYQTKQKIEEKIFYCRVGCNERFVGRVYNKYTYIYTYIVSNLNGIKKKERGNQIPTNIFNVLWYL